jgi:hypothetical protein
MSPGVEDASTLAQRAACVFGRFSGPRCFIEHRVAGVSVETARRTVARHDAAG